MRNKNLFIIIIVILLTIAIVQNTEKVNFTLILFRFKISKIAIILISTVVGFIFGLNFGIKNKGKDNINNQNNNSSRLSEEDNNYIN